MKKVSLFFFSWLISLSVFALEVIDDAGNKIFLQHPAKRIISLAPDLTEIVFAVGAGPQLVGVMQGCDYPPEAKSRPLVASFNSVNVEKVYSLRPDLILVWGESKLTASLKKLGIPIYVSHAQKLLDVPQSILRIGCLTGSDTQAKKVADNFLQRYQTLKNNYSAKTTVHVFFEIWDKPLMTITKKSWINDVIVLCGGKNNFANLLGVAPTVNKEAVIMQNPDIILGESSNKNWKATWLGFKSLRTVQKGYLFDVDSDLIDRAGPRLINGAEQMCELIDKVRG